MPARFYSDYPRQRIMQIGADLGAALFLLAALAVVAGIVAIASSFAGAAMLVEDGGARFTSKMNDVAAELTKIPFVGHPVSAQLRAASDAGSLLSTAAHQARAVVSTTACLTCAFVIGMALALLWRIWIRQRLRFARNARMARNLLQRPDGLDLLALRAIAHQPLTSLLSLSEQPLNDWQAGSQATIARLAELELKAAGIRITVRP